MKLMTTPRILSRRPWPQSESKRASPPGQRFAEGRRSASSAGRSPRVLILSASAGVGHLRAAEAVEVAVRQICPEAHVVNIDALSMTNAAFRQIYGRTYFDLVKHVPHLIGYLYDRLDGPITSTPFDKPCAQFQQLQLRKLVELLESEPWDLAINTHFLPASIIASLRHSGRISFPQVMVTTDFYIHSMWVKQPVEWYFAASQESAIDLSAYVPQETIGVTGIPIHPAFAEPLDKAECRRKHGIAAGSKMVLQLAGGCGVGPIEQIHRRALEARRPLHLVTVTGRNEKVKTKLNRMPIPPRHDRTVLGYTTKMHELIAAADLVISKPGGLTTSECLAVGRPMLIIDPIPGQESRNSDYLLEKGAGAKVNLLQSLPLKLDALLQDEARLTEMGTAAARLGRPRAAFEVAARALSFIGVPVAR